MRSGAQTLVMLAAPLNAAILRALADGPKLQAELQREAGHPAQTTLRTQLMRLCDRGVVEKRRRNSFPGALEYELSDAGRDLLPAMIGLERWLALAPQGRLELGGSTAKAAVKALTEGWSTTMLRALAARPLTLTELAGVITALSYPSVERRLAAMRLAGLVEAHPAQGRGTPYSLTDWARRGVAPLTLAARWERRHAPAETAPVTGLDVETALLLGADLLSPPQDACGSCRLVVELRDRGVARPAGVLVAVRDGAVISRSTRLEGDSDAWATGSLFAWFAAALERDIAGLELGGDCALARALIEGMRDFSSPKRASTRASARSKR